MSEDRWTTEGAHRMRQHIMRGTVAGRNYAPDTTYEQLKAGHCGPHSLRIAEILEHWVRMWAGDMGEAEKCGFELDASAQFAASMREADAEVDRYLAANHLTRAA